MAATQQKRLPKPVDFDQLYPGRFLKSGELLGKKVTVTIKDVEIDELENEKGKKVQGIIHLEESGKQIVLNKTNGLCLKGMFGRRLDDWKGKRITIYQDQVKFGADTVDAIRIWGSPDIDRDKDISISLPRKKPFTMTMHKMTQDQQRPAQRSSAPQSSAFDPSTAPQLLNGAANKPALDTAWDAVTAGYDALGIDIPLDMQTLYKDRSAELERL